nr:nickel pincer cofactor biosynthesis protein LarB [Desulfobacterales bacterium]
MEIESLKRLLESFRSGHISVNEVIDRIKHLPFEDIKYACIDHHRPLRKGFPEVIFGEGKTVKQIEGIMERMVYHGDTVMVTRLDATKAERLSSRFPESVYYSAARVLVHSIKPIEVKGKGTILVVSAGTSDIPVAEEALITARTMGNHVEALYDVGVCGIHRLLSYRDTLEKASVFIVVAGMEGALPSVVGGLVDRPVIAVPTSVGYGAGFGGISALLGMLNSCAPGVTVVNIDNGFGAGYVAALINRI